MSGTLAYGLATLVGLAITLTGAIAIVRLVAGVFGSLAGALPVS